MNHTLYHDEENTRYEFHINGLKPFVQYVESDGILLLTHTLVPEELEGEGIGTELVQKTLDAIRKTDKKIMPVCPFIDYFIDEHPDYKSLVAD